MTDEIKTLEAELAAINTRAGEIKEALKPLYLKARNAFPVGSVISWSQGKNGTAYGRVIRAIPEYSSQVSYRVIRIRADGSEGESCDVSSYVKPQLVADEYEEGKIYREGPAAPVRLPKETAERIYAHLKEMEADVNFNPHPARGYYKPSAHVSGGRVAITYITYQDATHLTTQEAEVYLDWLDAGNRGRHYNAIKETK